MTKTKRILAAAALFGLAALTGFAQKTVDLSGTWVGKTEVPGVGMIDVTLVLEKTEKCWRGTIASDNQAVINGNLEVMDVTVEGENFSFVFPLADGALVLMKLVVAGDKMTGNWEHPSGSTGAMEFVKKK